MLRPALRTIVRALRGEAAYRFTVKNWIELGDLQRCSEVLQTMRFSRSLKAEQSDGPGKCRIAVLAPHADDEAVGPGGTLLKAVAAGAEITVIYLSEDADAEVAAVRRAEAVAAARTLGAEARFLDAVGHAIPVDGDYLAAFVAAVRDARPEVVMLPFLADDHDDHRRTNELMWRAVASGALATPREVWAYQVYTTLPGNVVVDITAEAERKQALIRSYRSQMQVRDFGHWALGLNAFLSRFLPRSPEPRYAEAFFVLPGDAYHDLCGVYFAGDPAECYYEDGYRRGASDAVQLPRP